MMDEPSSTSGFGLLRSDLSPRPALLALGSLLGLLSDEPRTFTPGRLTYSLLGSGTEVESTLLQKSDGSFWLAIWLKASIYDVNTSTPTPVAPLPVTLVVGDGKTASESCLINATGMTACTKLSSNSVNVSVRSEVTLIKIQ
jgi:hypothetical protein